MFKTQANYSKQLIQQWKDELRREKQVQPAIPLDRAIRAAASLRARLTLRRKVVMA